jgi:hypothetical protein
VAQREGSVIRGCQSLLRLDFAEIAIRTENRILMAEKVE